MLYSTGHSRNIVLIPRLLLKAGARIVSAFTLSLLLAACGGGGGGGSDTPPLTVQGLLLTFPSGAAPTGWVNALVSITDPSTGDSITNASVTVNGVALTYNDLPSRAEYEGAVSIEPGASVTLIASWNGHTYTATGTQPSSYPVLTQPTSGDIWGTYSNNAASWTGGAATGDANYLFGIMDGSAPLDNSPILVLLPTSTNAYTVPAFSMSTAGSKTVIIGTTTMANVSNADANSGLIIGGFNYVPITAVIGITPTPPTLTSIAVVPANPTLANGSAAQMKVIGTYSDSSTQDLTDQAVWSSLDQTKVTLGDTGLISGIANGSTTITASLGNMSASTTAYVFTPTSVAADWATFQGNAAHTGFVDVQLDPAAFAQIWTWTVPPNTGGNPVHINSVATSAGKVFVTKDIYFDQAVLYALNEADGSTDWLFSFGQMASEGPPAIANGTVFVPTNASSSNCAMWAIDATLGTYQSKMPSNCQWSAFFAPTIFEGNVLQTSQAGMTSSYTSVTGGLQWSASSSGADQSTPAADGSYVYQYGVNGLQVFDRFAGTLVASISDPFYSSNSGSSLFSAPMLGASNNAISYSGAGFSGWAWSSSEQYDSRILVNYDIAGKTFSWQSANAYLTHPAIANGVIYVARNAPATLDALSETDGHVLWSWTPPPGDTEFHRNTVVTRNLVFVSTDKNVYAVDLNTHQSVWQYPKPGMLAISANNVLYIVTGATLSDGNLVAIKLQ